MLKRSLILVLLVSALLPAREARADDCTLVSRSNLAACAVRASARVAGDRQGVKAAEGRRAAAAPWFPSNPLVAVSAARRSANGEGQGPTVNWTASLAQEVEIAGQRASRRRAAEADLSARANDVVATTRNVAASAYVAYFDVLATRDSLALARRLEATGTQVARVTRARADAGVTSAVDAEVAEAASLRLARDRLEAERAHRVASAVLATLLGRDPRPSTADSVTVTGELEPLVGTDAVLASASKGAVVERPEMKALRDEERAHAARAEAFRRAAIPTVTVQLFAQNDGYNERVFGAGVVLPIPLPQPLGRTYVGEAAESEAFSRQTGSRAEHVARSLASDLAVAVAGYEAAKGQAALYTPEKITRTERVIADMATEIEAGRLAVRDAVVAQQHLMDLLRARVDARRALSVASVDVALAAGVPIESGTR